MKATIPHARPILTVFRVCVLLGGICAAARVGLAQAGGADTDVDGLPDAWEQRYLGTLAYGPNADPGGVGRTLLQSYQQGLNP